MRSALYHFVILFWIQTLLASDTPSSDDLAGSGTAPTKSLSSQKTNLSTCEFAEITSIKQSTTPFEDTAISKVTLQRERHGIFDLLTPPVQLDFVAPHSTDIALQASINLSKIPNLLRSYHKQHGSEPIAENILSKEFGDTTLETFLLSTKSSRIHLCIDFDDTESLFLGKESIGRPHIALRLDGAEELIDAVVQHYISARGALFKKQDTPTGTLYTLPDYFAEAISDYLPVIQINTDEKSAIIASDQKMLDRILSPAAPLASDPTFLKTWKKLPDNASLKLYFSKRSIQGLHHFYKKAMKEKWIDSPMIDQNKMVFNLLMYQLNSSEAGIALTIDSQKEQDVLTLKSPIPSSVFLWLLTKTH